MYRCQLSFSATIVNPAACWRSSPEGEIRFPVARKFDNLVPISKFTLDNTFKKYRPRVD
jgi:hypothetical protein